MSARARASRSCPRAADPAQLQQRFDRVRDRAEGQRDGDGVEAGIREGECFGVGLHESEGYAEVRCPLTGVSQHFPREIDADGSRDVWRVVRDIETAADADLDRLGSQQRSERLPE